MSEMTEAFTITFNLQTNEITVQSRIVTQFYNLTPEEREQELRDNVNLYKLHGYFSDITNKPRR
jgi:hypothetical protein